MANNLHHDVPETLCMFKPIGISRHQDVAKLLRQDELVKIMIDGDSVGIFNLAFQKIGNLPPYLETILRTCVDTSPDGCLYGKVKSIAGANSTIGVWCVLLDAPWLPEYMNSGKLGLTVWHGKAKGVTFENRQDVLKQIETAALCDGEYPLVVLQREPSNPSDSNAIRLLAYLNDSWKQLGYIDRHDAKDIVHAATTGMSFYVRLISTGLADDATIGARYEVVGMTGKVEGFEALA